MSRTLAPAMSDLPVELPSAMARTAAELTSAMAAGEEQAIEQFYRHYFPLLFAEARRATHGDEAFCLDVMQEAMLKIIATIRRVETEWQLIAWLRLVVRTTAYDLLRGEARRRRRESVAGCIVPDGAPPDLAVDERLEWLSQQIAAMDRQLVRIIELRFESRWTLCRIAGALGVSTATVDGRLRRALKHLRGLAREKFDE